jgi:AcrR family transcriptional regulator
VGDKEQDVKERILLESMRLFLANGFVGTSVKNLTDAAGIARGTLYWHFSSKDQILDEILNRYSKQFVNGWIETIKGEGRNFLTKFYALYKFITEFTRDHRELLLVFDTLFGEISRNGTKAASKMKEIRSKLRVSIESLLAAGQKEGMVDQNIDVTMHAHIIMATFTGMLLNWFVYEDVLDAVAYSRAFRETLLRGLISEKANAVRKAAAAVSTPKGIKRKKDKAK